MQWLLNKENAMVIPFASAPVLGQEKEIRVRFTYNLDDFNPEHRML